MCKRTYIPALFVIAAVSAHATQIISSNVGLSNPDQTLTFSEVVIPDMNVLTDQYLAFGVSFTGAPFFNGFSYNSSYFDVTAPGDGAKPDISNCISDIGCNLSLSINFSHPVSGAAFDFAGILNGGFDFVASLGPAFVDQAIVTFASTTPNGVDGWGYFGFTGEVFDSITIYTVRIFPGNGAPFVLDNLETTAAPEPSTLLLCSGAILILTLSRRLFPRI
jgi:hypothetical protein